MTNFEYEHMADHFFSVTERLNYFLMKKIRANLKFDKRILRHLNYSFIDHDKVFIKGSHISHKEKYFYHIDFSPHTHSP